MNFWHIWMKAGWVIWMNFWVVNWNLVLQILWINLGLRFPTLLCSPAPCKISKNTLGPENIIRTLLLMFSENKIWKQSIWIFCVFLWCQGSLLTVIRSPHKLQCNCSGRMKCNCRGRIKGQQWPWNHKYT